MSLENGSRQTRITITWMNATSQTINALVEIESWRGGKNAESVVKKGKVAEFRAEVSRAMGSRSIRFYGMSDGEYVPAMTEEESNTIKAMLVAYIDAKANSEDSYVWVGLKED